MPILIWKTELVVAVLQEGIAARDANGKITVSADEADRVGVDATWVGFRRNAKTDTGANS